MLTNRQNGELYNVSSVNKYFVYTCRHIVPRIKLYKQCSRGQSIFIKRNWINSRPIAITDNMFPKR